MVVSNREISSLIVDHSFSVHTEKQSKITFFIYCFHYKQQDCHECALSGAWMCLRVRRVEVRVQQVAIDYLSVVCVPECECKVTGKVYEFQG